MSAMQKNRRNCVLLAAIAGVSIAFAGCGKEAYVVTPSAQTSQAPGHFTVPPKVDILLAEDDTGSMYEAYSQISQQMPKFLTSLEGKGWDYHFATIPLTTDRALTQVLASYYDSNWGSLWQQPYPGAQPNAPGTVSASVFATPDQYGGFITLNDISNAKSGSEPGFETIRLALANRIKGTNFLRPDALFVILVMGNGNDTSGVTFCTRSDGATVPCEYAGYPQYGTMQSSFNYYQQQFLASKNSVASQIKFYAAVAANNVAYPGCLGGGSWAGLRYQQMAKALGGASIDICSTPVASVLDQVATNLQAVRIAFRTKYLFISQDADPTSIQVVRQIGGDPGNTVVIPQDPSNGWTYDGYVSNVYTIDYPTPMNQASGYAIELHGSAELVGDDTAAVTFKPAGAKNSSAN